MTFPPFGCSLFIRRPGRRDGWPLLVAILAGRKSARAVELIFGSVRVKAPVEGPATVKPPALPGDSLRERLLRDAAELSPRTFWNVAHEFCHPRPVCECAGSVHRRPDPGDDDGTIQVTVDGGAGTYTVAWAAPSRTFNVKSQLWHRSPRSSSRASCRTRWEPTSNRNRSPYGTRDHRRCFDRMDSSRLERPALGLEWLACAGAGATFRRNGQSMRLNNAGIGTRSSTLRRCCAIFSRTRPRRRVW